MYYIHENESDKNINFEKDYLKENAVMDNDYIYVVMVIPRKEVDKKANVMQQMPSKVNSYADHFTSYYPNVRYY